VLAPAHWTIRRRATVRFVAASVTCGLLFVGLLSALGRLALAPVGSSARPAPPLAGGAQLLGEGRFGSVAAGAQPVQDWLAAGRVPDPQLRYASMARTALADLHALTLENGGIVASLAPQWRYVWPRDSAFAAVALAHSGHLADAVRALQFLQRVQAPDGSFQARYHPDGSAVLDGRGGQEDDPGWALWAVDAVLAAEPQHGREALAHSLRPLVHRSLERLVDRTSGPGALPAPGGDYWEVRESRLTLGIAAPTLAGLYAGSRLVSSWDAALAHSAAADASRLRTSIEVEFGASGYSRYAGGAGPDAAVTFLLPPFLDSPLNGAPEVADSAVPRLRQPAGGVSPGATWPRRDGVSWTPETALFMLSAAEAGDRVDATNWLTWLAAHSTASGSLPEKVRADGRAGAVAPLAWTDALVVLTLDRLDQLTTVQP
jgi:glucoamylase